jgi:muconolactone D-isomerase
MDFLVEISVELPPEMPAEEVGRLREAELERGRELLESGSIRSIWRIPGGRRNVGIWSAADPTVLHSLIESLPMFAWLKADVTALAEHPLSRHEA